jgi:hypothetical protein
MGNGTAKISSTDFRAAQKRQNNTQNTRQHAKITVNSFINLMPSTPQKRLYGTTNIVNKANRIIYGYYYAYWMDCISSYEVPLFFNTIINRPFHWNHFCTSMSSVILHDDKISDIGWCGANFFSKTFLKLCEAITTHGTGNLNFVHAPIKNFCWDGNSFSSHIIFHMCYILHQDGKRNRIRK